MNRSSAIILILFGATLMSFVGLILRLIESADAFQILTYRSLSLAAAVAVFACVRRRVSFTTFLSSIDRWSVLVGCFLCAAFSFYVYSLLNTSIASGLLILSSAPVFAAFLGWVILGEKPTATTWIALFMAIFGVGIMVFDGLGSGRMLGNLFALISAFCFAAMLVTVRAIGREEPLGGTFLGGVFACILNAFLVYSLSSGFVISGWDFGLSLFMGAFTIGLGIACVTLAAGFLPPSEVGVLVLLESVLGPLWVWLLLGEVASAYVLAGGAIVLLAVVLQAFGGKGARPVQNLNQS